MRHHLVPAAAGNPPPSVQLLRPPSTWAAFYLPLLIALLLFPLASAHSISPLRADFDGSGRVGFGDFLLFASAFGSSDETFDLDAGGRVDFGDFLLFAAVFGSSVDASAAVTYHISPNGSDTANGSSSAPWRTLQHAADRLQPGELVRVATGTYTGLHTVRSGTASKPITFLADGDSVIISGRNANTADNINIENTDYIVIDGFLSHQAQRDGIRIVNARGVTIRNNRNLDNARFGILTGWTPEIRILNNETGRNGEHGIYVSNSRVDDDNPIVRGNHVHGNGQNGIQFNGDPNIGGDGLITGGLIEENIVHDSHWKGLSLIAASETLIRNNIFYNNGTSNAGAGGIHIVEETGVNGNPTVYSLNNVVVNNTVVEPRIAGIRINEQNTGNIVFNNIAVSSNPIALEGSGNRVHSGSNVTAASTAGLFADPASGDFRLVDGSPALDVGLATYEGHDAPSADISGRLRPDGAAYDAGVYERETETPSTASEITSPKVERVAPADAVSLDAVPGVFFSERFESGGGLQDIFHDSGDNHERFRISTTDPFSGKTAIQQTYIPIPRTTGDPGSGGWGWRFFGDNPHASSIADPSPVTTAVARWYHKYEEGFQPRDGWQFPQKMARMRAFHDGPWSGAYTVLFWFSGEDGHLSIERHTRAPDAHREWLPNHVSDFRLSDAHNTGRWIHYELRVALGEGARADTIQAWADGVLLCNIVGDDLSAGYRDYTLNGMSWDCYWNNGSPADQSRFFDDIALSSSPIGPARSPVNPIIHVTGDPSQAWQIEIAEATQLPLVVADSFDGVTTRLEPAAFERDVVWTAHLTGSPGEITVDAATGRFPPSGSDRLRHNRLHQVRVRRQAASGQWSPWSPWHAGFATEWADGKPRVLPIGFAH